MANRWESSGRPLFVKTVYVNGNRHAILSQEDPLLRSRDSFFKKTSRPNSSFSFNSDVSVTSTESRQSCEGRKARGWKDLSSELQDCLVKLRLASNNGEKATDSSLSERTKVTGNSTSKKQKWGRGRRKKIQNVRERFTENERKDCQNDYYRYVYNFDSNKGKKNYCFVKISSQPQGVILDSVCDDSQHFLKPKSNNLVISAAFHNLVLTPYETEKISKNKSGYFSPFEDPAELYWHNYLTRSPYNSLSERVIQWLDLIKKRKRMQNSVRNSESVSEEIASRRTSLNKNSCERQKESMPRKESLEDVEGEVKGEPNAEMTLSVVKVERDWEDEENMRETNENASTRSKFTDAACEENSKMPKASGWERKTNQEKEIDVDSHSVTVTCRCEKNRRYYANEFEIATQEFPERNQNQIDNPNVTRTRPISDRKSSLQLLQKEISPEQMVWASNRDIGRPQLHIFIPTVPSKDPSEESLSECEPQITEV